MEQIGEVIPEFADPIIEAAIGELPAIELPKDLIDRLREATEYYNITELAELITQVETHGEVGTLWAARLRNCVDRYDMAVLRGLIAAMDG